MDAMIWDKWISIFPNMDKKNFVSFEDYKKQHFSNADTKNSNKKLSKEEIIANAEKVKEKHLKRKKVNK
jgi:hypothetical protein